MNLKHAVWKLAILALMSLLLVGKPLYACSTIKLQHGRELLYGHNLNNNGSDIPGLVFINKRGVFKTGRSWDEMINRDRRKPSTASWIARYGSVTFNTFAKDFPDGGMNEAGIYIWEMGLSHSAVTYPKGDGLPRLNQMHWMQYILDNAATLDEALDCARTFAIDGWGWHFFLGDRDGCCAVIDFIDGQVVVHRGEQMPVPGLFNARYDRELEQARYFKGFGGQYEPVLSDPKVPRYVKTGIMGQAYDGRENALDYCFKMLDHLFVSEVADWSVVFDVRRRRVHFRTSLNRAIKYFSLDDCDFSATAPVMILNIDIPAGGDVGRQFTPYSHDKMAAFIRTVPLPREFCEMGGLTVSEFVERLACHTDFARDSRNQFFLGDWRLSGENGDAAPRWRLTLRSQGDVVSGEIDDEEGFVRAAPIEQVQLVDQTLSFSFRNREQLFVFVKGKMEKGRMKLTFNGLETEYGSFELERFAP